MPPLCVEWRRRICLVTLLTGRNSVPSKVSCVNLCVEKSMHPFERFSKASPVSNAALWSLLFVSAASSSTKASAPGLLLRLSPYRPRRCCKMCSRAAPTCRATCTVGWMRRSPLTSWSLSTIANYRGSQVATAGSSAEVDLEDARNIVERAVRAAAWAQQLIGGAMMEPHAVLETRGAPTAIAASYRRACPRVNLGNFRVLHI